MIHKYLRALIAEFEEERQRLAHSMAAGLPDQQYQNFVGRYRGLGEAVAKTQAMIERLEEGNDPLESDDD